MENRLELDDHTVTIGDNIAAHVSANVHYEPCWENGDYDYAGTHCTHGVGGTRRVGLELQEAPIDYVDIVNYSLQAQRKDGVWMELIYIDNEKLHWHGAANKDFITWLELQIKEDGNVQQRAYDDAKENVPEPDYDC